MHRERKGRYSAAGVRVTTTTLHQVGGGSFREEQAESCPHDKRSRSPLRHLSSRRSSCIRKPARMRSVLFHADESMPDRSISAQSRPNRSPSIFCPPWIRVFAKCSTGLATNQRGRQTPPENPRVDRGLRTNQVADVAIGALRERTSGRRSRRCQAAVLIGCRQTGDCTRGILKADLLIRLRQPRLGGVWLAVRTWHEREESEVCWQRDGTRSPV